MPDRFESRNVLGGRLEMCSREPLTGFYRDGCCNVGPDDHGVHGVCVQVTEAFLAYSRSKGNDLSSPSPEFAFPGLKDGDRWCLCAPRWKEAYKAGAAPQVVLAATHEAALEFASLEELMENAIDVA